jgi:hypothetical protein
MVTERRERSEAGAIGVTNGESVSSSWRSQPKGLSDTLASSNPAGRNRAGAWFYGWQGCSTCPCESRT